jgi:hypothetical protein
MPKEEKNFCLFPPVTTIYHLNVFICAFPHNLYLQFVVRRGKIIQPGNLPEKKEIHNKYEISAKAQGQMT